MFSFVASFMEAYKVLSGWIYWIVLNLATVFLYVSKDLYIYAGYSLVLAVLSVIGYMQWLNSYKEQIASNNYLDEIH
jgi:nicotinamide mononucleotide transporter